MTTEENAGERTASARFSAAIRRVLPDASGFESQRYLIKWLFLSSLIGVVAGFSAIVFTYAIDAVTQLSLGRFAGFLPPSPIGEGNRPITPIAHPWIVPLLTALGGLISGIIVFNLAPEAEGHGTDAAIDAIHHKRGKIRSRIPPIKLIASAITIGSGGSGGREGPTAQMSAGFGSILADWLRLSPQDRRIAVCVGIGSGIGAIFRAPLGGALMAAEVLYIHDLEVEAIVPTLIGSIIGYSIYGAYCGYSPIFGNFGSLGFNHPIQLLYYGILGVLCGVGGILYKECFYGTVRIFHRIPIKRWLKPALGGLLVGLIGLVLPGALHTGYGWVQVSMGKGLLAMPIWIVLLLPVAKIISTSLSIGSGGSGGIFGPGMVIGGFFGACFWRLTYHHFPGMPPDPAPFVIIGMMALFGGIAHAPLAVMLMVAEMTGNLSLLAPAMLAVALATAVVGDHTIYQSQLRTRADSPAHKVRMSFPLLSSLLVRDAMSAPPGDANPESIDKNALFLEPDQSLDVALERMAGRSLSRAPVVQDSKIIGELKVSDIVKTYKSTLVRSVRRAGSLTPESTLIQVQVQPDSALAGRTLREAAFPKGTMVISVTIDGKTIFPNANTYLDPGSTVLVMANRDSEPALQAFLNRNNGTHASEPKVKDRT